MSRLSPISLKVSEFNFTVALPIEEKNLESGDRVHAEIPHRTKTFILCYVERDCRMLKPFHAVMFLN